MNITLNGRAALITGGSKGLGLAMATMVAESGGACRHCGTRGEKPCQGGDATPRQRVGAGEDGEAGGDGAFPLLIPARVIQ